MPSRTRMAAIAVAARAREAMVQLALFPTECKPRRASILFSIKMGASRGIRRPSAFHSEACGKLVPQSARGAMHVRILLQIPGNDGTPGLAEEIAALEKRVERPEDLGLSLAEGKALTAAIQRRVVQAQVGSWTERHRCCNTCGVRRRSKGSYPVVFRTLYGDVKLASPRLHRCSCQDTEGPSTVSPLRTLIPGRIAPERLYLEARWSSLVPYAAAAELLTDVLPIASGANRTTVREHALRVAERAEDELGDERPCFIEGCRAEWQALPIPEGRIVAALDGGYVRNWNDRKSNF